MLDQLRRLLSDLTGASEHDEFALDDHRVAAAALLVNLVSADGVASESEKIALHDVLKARFALDEHETAELIEAGRRREADAVDLYGFTSVLKRSLDAQGRAGVVEMMWEIVFADGAAHELEDNIVWRAADLLGVSDRERVELKRRIAARAKPLGAAEPA
ncbi:TerB family tellurite resistance protein [Chenggangzhangella methanolivorans]|uniref:TerB family tellurite resistance protein n=1 Tax=Chenggangzhangella methanolivorans TaxID=1437009 RepID=A0A9E6UKV7_9HYPH|nr:TerB family tellurite resistance protein [Chenggangzhangella methanolivorans]QZN98320.1 TerB family tellurite resistance protein [Chenggangzhangella methanolivorans]